MTDSPEELILLQKRAERAWKDFLDNSHINVDWRFFHLVKHAFEVGYEEGVLSEKEAGSVGGYL